MASLQEVATIDGSIEEPETENSQTKNQPEKTDNVANATKPSKKSALLEGHREAGLFEKMAEARAEGDEGRVQVIRKVLAAMQDRVDGGDLYIPEELAAKQSVSEEELEQEIALQLGRTEQIDPPGMPKPQKGASEVNTIRLHGRAGSYRPEIIEEMSGWRYALISQIEEKTRQDFRMLRVEVFEPPSTGLSDVEECRKRGIPFPNGGEEAERAQNVGLGSWQMTEVYHRLKAFARETNRLMFYTEPKAADGSYTLSMMDWEAGLALAKNDLGNMHYMHVLLSGVGTFGHGEDHRPDFEEVHYEAMSSFGLMSRVEELIGHGPYAEEDPDGDGRIIVDGGTIKIPAPQQEGTEKALESQFRLITHAEDLKAVRNSEEPFEALKSVLREAGVVKGTTYPISRSRLWSVIDRFWAEAERLEENGSEGALDQLLEDYQDAALFIERLLLKTERTGKSAILLSKEDQLKIPTSKDEGIGLFGGTYLRGCYQNDERPPEPPGPKSLELTPPAGRQAVPKRERLELRVPGPNSGRFEWATHEKLRQAHGLSPNRTEELPVYGEDKGFVAHAFTGESPGSASSTEMGPAQFHIRGNWQPYQCLKPGGVGRLFRHEEKTLEEIARKLQTPQGIAEVTSRKVARQRQEILSGSEEEVGQDQDLLSAALTSGLLWSKSGDLVSQIEGDRPPIGESQVNTLSSVKARIEKVVAAHVDNFVIGACATRTVGYIHHACEDSMELLRRRWSVQEKATCDPSSIAIPKRITSMMNADDDGDLISGLSAIVAGPGTGDGSQQLRKVIMIFRYPCVDEPIFMAVPPSVETPFDPRTQEEADRFGRIIEIFQPVIKSDEPDLHSDEITLATPIASWRLSGSGAKEAVSKTKISGQITQESSFRFVKRGKGINSTGALTRHLERFFELAWKAQAETQTRDKSHLQPGEQGTYEKAVPKFLARAAGVSVQAEEQITAMKYETGGEDPDMPPLVLGGGGTGDPFLHADDDHVRGEVFPLEHHNLAGSIRTIRSRRFLQEKTSLQQLFEGEISQRLPGQSRRSQMIRAHFAEGRGIEKVIGTFEAIGDDPGLVRSRISTSEETDPDHVALAKQAFELWSSSWSTLSGRMTKRLSQAQTDRQRQAITEEMNQKMTAQSRAIRGLMRWVGNSLDGASLREAISQQLSAPGTDPEYRDQDRQPVSPAAALALADGRIGEMLPLPGAKYRPPQPDGTVAIVFTKGQDLAGEESLFGADVLEPIEGKSGFKDEPSGADASGLHEGLFRATSGHAEGEQVRLFSDNEVPDVLRGPVRLVPVSKRRAALVKR